jgi:GAF domain-containing protein
MPVVWVKNGPLKGRTFDIRDAVITIGRDTSETIQILDQGVSRQHSEIFRIGEMCFIRDLNSTNGTFVNDQRVSEELLRSGDQVRIGSTILVFEDKTSSNVLPPKEVELTPGGADEKVGTTVWLKVGQPEPGEKGRPMEAALESRHIDVLYDVAHLASTEKDLAGLYPRALERLAKAVRAERGYVFLLDPASGKLVARGGYEPDPGVERKVSRAIVKQVLQSGRSLLTSDAATDARFALSESVVLRRIRSVLAAPILAGGKSAGILYLHSDRTGESFGKEDLELATAVAIQLGMATTAFHLTDRARRSTTGVVKALVTAMELRNPERQGHSERVANYATAIAVQMGMPKAEIQRIQLAALLHDVGKIATPAEPPPGADKAAWRAEHVAAGEKIVAAIEGFEDLLPGIKFHHERADGSGFPHKKKNADVPVMARIVIVANVFDTMCAYGGVGGGGIPVKQVLVDLGKEGKALYDEKVLEALLVAHRNNTLYQTINVFES